MKYIPTFNQLPFSPGRAHALSTPSRVPHAVWDDTRPDEIGPRRHRLAVADRWARGQAGGLFLLDGLAGRWPGVYRPNVLDPAYAPRNDVRADRVLESAALQQR